MTGAASAATPSAGGRLIRGSALRTAYLGLEIPISFLLMPFLVATLGVEQYGIWVVSSSVVATFVLLDIGLSSATSRFLARYAGAGDRAGLLGTFGTLVVVYWLLGALGIAVVAAIAPLVPAWLGQPGYAEPIRAVVLTLGCSFFLTFPTRPYAGMLQSHFRHDLLSLIDIGKLLLRSAGLAWLVWQGLGLPEMAGWVALVQLLAAIGVVRASRVSGEAPRADWRAVTRARLREVFEYSAWVVLGQIASLLKYRVDVMVVSRLVGAASVSHYSVGLRLVEYMVQLVQAVMGAIGPVFSRAEGRGDYASIRRNFVFLVKISAVVTAFIAVMLFLYGPLFIERWMGPEFEVAGEVLRVVVIGSALGMAQAPIFSMLYGISRHRVLGVVALGEGIANLVLSIVLARRFGVLGVAFGTLIPMLITTLAILPWYACRSIGLPVTQYVRSIARPIAVSLAALLVPWLALGEAVQADYGSLLGAGALHAALFAACVWPLAFGADDRQRLSAAAWSSVRRIAAAK